MLNVLSHQGMQTKATLRVHLIPVEMVMIFLKISNNITGVNTGRMEPLFTIGGSADWCSHDENQCGNSSRSWR